MDSILSILFALIVMAVSIFISYLITKAAVSAGIRDALWNLEVSMRNAVKAGVQEALKEQEQVTAAHMQDAVKKGVQEALQEIEKAKTEENNG